MEEATKPQEGKNVTKRATAYIYKAHEEVQTGQVTAAPEATAEEVATTKRRRRRSARSKVGAAARKGQKGEFEFSLLLFNSCILFYSFGCCYSNCIYIVQSLMVIVSECAADPSDAVNGPTVSDDPKEEQQVVEVIEEGTTKHNEGEMPHWSGGDSLHFVSLSLSQLSDFLNYVL